MNSENEFSNSPGSSDGTARSPETTTREGADTINDQDVTDLIAHDPAVFFLTVPVDHDELPVEVGDAEPVEGPNRPIAVPDDQPIELDPHRQQPDDQIPYLPSPIDQYIAHDDQAAFSPGPHAVPVDVNINMNLPDDDILLIERETVAEFVQHEDNDVHIELTETIAIEPVESPVQHEPINNQIHNLPVPTIIEIDLTLDDEEDSNHSEMHEIESNGDVSPVTIDLTSPDNADQQREVELIDLTGDNDDREGSIQMASNVNHDEQPNDPPVGSIAQRLAPVAEPSAEAADHNPISSTTTSHAHQTLETTAQLQVPVVLPRNKKRVISSDESRHDIGNMPGDRKRRRQTAS